tara:strand:+ start:308 stop:481 length:174 start_codon:yes stop_codon:yes gene_type:complete
MSKLEQILMNNPNAFKKNASELQAHLKTESKRMADYKKARAVKVANPQDGEYFSPIK